MGMDLQRRNSCFIHCAKSVVTYNTPGIYNVQLIATNAGGSNTMLKTAYITVTDPYAGTLMITEIMQNPICRSDAAGEWFEVYNPTSSPINMNGWKIKDNGTDSILSPAR